MVYTFENRCIENSKLSLNDGAKRLFLYSNGEIGRDEELYQLLQYIECSREQNAVNIVTRMLHQMVERVKHNQDVGVRYLKAIEWEEYIREKATREGMEQGLEQGLEQGTKKIVRNMLKQDMSVEEVWKWKGE